MLTLGRFSPACLFFFFFLMLLMRRCLNIYLFIAVLGLHCCMGLSPVAESGLLSSHSHRLLTALVSPIVEHGLWSPGQIAVVHGLSCSAGCEIFPDKGLIGSMSPALAGGFFTTEPPGKPLSCFLTLVTARQQWDLLSRHHPPHRILVGEIIQEQPFAGGAV